MSIEERLEKLERKIDLLLEKTIPIENASTKMTSHIEFVEAVYDTVKDRMNYVMSFVQEPLVLKNS